MDECRGMGRSSSSSSASSRARKGVRRGGSRRDARLSFATTFSGSVLLVALLSACTVGPAHVRPEIPLPAQFDQAPSAQADGVPALLWRGLGQPELEALIDRALAENTSVAQAAARLAETRALSGLSLYSLFPTVTATADAERSRPSQRDPMIPADQGRSDTYRAGFDARWEIDLFGSLRNQKDAIERRVEADAAALADARLSVVAEVAQSWFALRGARRQLALGREQVENWARNVELLERLLAAGRSTALDVARARTQARSAAARLPALEADIVRQEQRLAVLTGGTVEQLRPMLVDSDELPRLPELATVGTPAEWLERRPDVRAAERRLAAATSDVGYEKAQYFPILELLGGGGWTATRLSDLGSSGSERWRFGPALSWRFLDFGRVKQNVAAAEARVDGAIAAYRESVLRALEDTENALAGLRAANQTAVETRAALEAADEASRLSLLRFEAGVSNYLDVLDAERSRNELASQSARADLDQATALVAVYKALAGDFALPE